MGTDNSEGPVPRLEEYKAPPSVLTWTVPARWCFVGLATSTPTTDRNLAEGAVRAAVCHLPKDQEFTAEVTGGFGRDLASVTSVSQPLDADRRGAMRPPQRAAQAVVATAQDRLSR